MTLGEVEQLRDALEENKGEFGVKRSKPIRLDDPDDWGLEIEYEYVIPAETVGLAARRKGNVELCRTAEEVTLVLQALYQRAAG